MIEKAKKLTLIELNEINFHFVKKYTEKYPKIFKNFSMILGQNQYETYSESEYENLEPWIQWVSAHTGKDFNEHNVFRLGDITNFSHTQIYEFLETHDYTVGSISPMNAANNLKNPSYFIPDPWTQTPPSKDFWSYKLHNMVQQTVNDNSKSRISFKSIITIFAAFIRFCPIKRIHIYLGIALKSISRPWMKAMFLDLLLHDVHNSFLREKLPDFSSVFFNAGAHIQHHYFFNSEFYEGKNRNPEWYISKRSDPLLDMLKIYEVMIGDYINDSNREYILATGLTQIPYDLTIFYYRLKDHDSFLRRLGIAFNEVIPRMSRDFLVTFNSISEKNNATRVLKNLRCKETGIPLFEEIEDRDLSLFITMTYPREIHPKSLFSFNDSDIKLYDEVALVAVKNGHHNESGYFFSSF